jgi:hypothetical protein
MKLTGILSTSVMNLGDRSSQHGIVVAPGEQGGGRESRQERGSSKQLIVL